MGNTNKIEHSSENKSPTETYVAPNTTNKIDDTPENKSQNENNVSTNKTSNKNHSHENKSNTIQDFFLRCECLTCVNLKQILQLDKLSDKEIVEEAKKRLNELSPEEKNPNNQTYEKSFEYIPLFRTAGFHSDIIKNKAYCNLCNTVVDGKDIDKESKFKCPWLLHVSKHCKTAKYASLIVELFDSTEKIMSLKMSFYRYYTFRRTSQNISNSGAATTDKDNNNNFKCFNCKPCQQKINSFLKTNAKTTKELECIFNRAEAGFFSDDKNRIKCFDCKNKLMSEDVWKEHKCNGLGCEFAIKHMPDKMLYNIEYEKQFTDCNHSENYINKLVSRRHHFHKYIKKRKNYGSKSYGTIYLSSKGNEKQNTQNLDQGNHATSTELKKRKATENENPKKEIGTCDANFLHFFVHDKQEKVLKENIKKFYQDVINYKQHLYTTCVTILEASTKGNRKKNTKKQNDILESFFEILKHFHQQFNDQHGGIILITNGIKTHSMDPIRKIMTVNLTNESKNIDSNNRQQSTVNSTNESKNTVFDSNISSLYIRLLGVTDFKTVANHKGIKDNLEKINSKRILIESDSTKLNPFVTDFIFIENHRPKDEESTISMPEYVQYYSHKILSKKSVAIILLLGDDFEKYQTLLNLSTKNNSTKVHNVILLLDKIDGEVKEKYQNVSTKFGAKITFISFKNINIRLKIIKFLYKVFCLGCREQLLQLKLLDENQIESFKNIIKRTCNDKNLSNLNKEPKYLNLDNIFISRHFMRYDKLRELLMYESVITHCADFTMLKDNFYQMMLFWAILTDKPDAADFFFESCSQNTAVASALVAAHLYKLKSDRSHISNTTLKNRQKEFSLKYIEIAISITDKRYLKQGEYKSVQEMLKKKHEHFSDMDCMKIAGIAKCGKFLDTEACRNVMDYKWHGKSAGSFVKFILGSALMFVILLKQLPQELLEIIKKHKAKEKQIQNTQNKQTSFLGGLYEKYKAKFYDKIKSCLNRYIGRNNKNERISKKKANPCEIIKYYLNKLGNWIYQTYSEELIKPKYMQNSVNTNKNESEPTKGSTDNLQTKQDKNKENNQKTSTFQFIEYKNTSVKIKKFFKAPISKFSLNLIFYTGFLIYYIFKVLTIKNSQWSSDEYFIFLWFLSFLIEEIYEILNADGKLFLGHVAISVFNVIDVVIILFAAITFFFRVYSLNEAAIYFYWLNGVLLIIRIFRELTAFRSIGPKLVMISIMLKQMINFFIVAFTLLTIFSFTSNMFSTSSLSFLRAYFVVGQLLYDYDGDFAQPFEDCINGVNKITSVNSGSCTSVAVPMYITSICFIYLINVLLINFFIALFNDVYTKYSTKSNEIWRLSLYSLIEEYQIRPYLPPPFSMIEIFFYCLKFLWLAIVPKCLVYQWKISNICSCDKSDEDGQDKDEAKEDIKTNDYNVSNNDNTESNNDKNECNKDNNKSNNDNNESNNENNESNNDNNEFNNDNDESNNDDNEFNNDNNESNNDENESSNDNNESDNDNNESINDESEETDPQYTDHEYSTEENNDAEFSGETDPQFTDHEYATEESDDAEFGGETDELDEF